MGSAAPSDNVVSSLRKVVSGGQTGVDQAALRAAKECGLEIGGWCPPGRVCEAGVIPAEFPLQETRDERSADAPEVPRSLRTEWNIRDSDATLVIGSAGGNRSGCPTISDAGTKWTIECAKHFARPLLVCDVDDPKGTKKIQEWLAALPITILNVAGPSESIAPGIGERAFALLRQVFETSDA